MNSVSRKLVCVLIVMMGFFKLETEYFLKYSVKVYDDYDVF